MTTVRIHSIQWDTDGEKIALPQEVTLSFDDETFDQEEAEDVMADTLTEMTGFCHKGFKYDIIG
ncbi:MAG TPA: hypothetical protein V6C65_13945 [Allocoleopsis sp.]